MTEQTTLIRFVGTREQAHAASKLGYEHSKDQIALGQRMKITFEVAEDEKSIKQRNFLHKAVFPQIEEQVVFPDGQRFEWRVWKEMFRARFLGDKWVLRAVPRWDKKLGRWVVPKKKTPYRVRVSTEDLGIRKYSNYIDLVIDTATVEYGVRFRFLAEEREEVRWKPKPAPAQPALPAPRAPLALVERVPEGESA